MLLRYNKTMASYLHFLSVTSSFEAPGFYQKFGYEIAYQLNDFPPRYQHFYLVKRLAALDKDT